MVKRKSGPEDGTKELRAKWARRISNGSREYSELHTAGNRVVDQYRIEQKSSTQQDKYNILYSITETIKPSLYSQTPKAEVKRRHTDRTDPIAIGASQLLEASITYTLDEQDFDEEYRAAIEDFLLPGLGVVWVRYQPTISTVAKTDESGQPIVDERGNPVTVDKVEYEKVVFDYIFWKDFLSGRARTWKETPWIAKRIYLDKNGMRDAGIPPEIVAKVQFDTAQKTQGVQNDNQSLAENQAAVWEIWDKITKQVIWYSDAYEDGVLKVQDDFLKLEQFFPCARPLRAVTTNNKFVPRPFFSQYQAQADELNDITFRIRKLVKALRVVGIYDASIPQLANLLQGDNNRMVPVDGWTTVQEKGGLKGTVDFLPITEVANVLMQLYDARERVKNEIYEITGWSDIIRGVSKASETLGAQQLKAEWAGARLKLLQKDVQRHIRDTFRIAGEIIAEHFGEAMLALMAGIDMDDELYPIFKKVVAVLREQKERCALIGVETDSTLLPDEANDRKDRMEFVGAAGAFLQQAVPAAQQTPALAPVLGEILMFAVRGFRSARSLETTFEQFRQNLASNPPKQEGDDKGGAAAAQATLQAKQADTQAKLQLGQLKVQQEDKEHKENTSIEMVKETNRHAEKMRELELREREVAAKERQVEVAERSQELKSIGDAHDRVLEQHNRAEDREEARQARSEGPGSESA